jgi:NADH-ubiquinone oxidoreductase chain 5
VHSSTLVTAGVFLIFRFHCLYNFSFFLFFSSLLTIFLAGVRAFYEYDLKKIIALSTLSQLGLIIMILSLGLKELAFFHLLSHALFKSMLFLCAGVYIHSISGIQDSKRLLSLQKISFLLGLLLRSSVGSLCGIPFIRGFYSKDLILEVLYIEFLRIRIFIFLVLIILRTLIYNFRLLSNFVI